MGNKFATAATKQQSPQGGNEPPMGAIGRVEGEGGCQIYVPKFKC